MNESKIDVAVLFIFFARPEQTAKVFEQIRIARPSKLFLYQDGAREGREDDVAGVEACRKIVENIDWVCEVHRWYQDHNEGCDPSEYLSQKWMFEHVDKGIILEDDDVPSQSFFPFCKELLDKYENDNRITIISGTNYAEVLDDCPYDYIFTSDIAIWGWATWRRVVEQWESTYPFIKDKYHMRLLKDLLKRNKLRDSIIPLMQEHETKKKEYYETILMACHYLNSGLSIVPSRNLINNIGVVGGTHYSISLEQMCKHDRRIFEMKRFELSFPMKHPKYVIENITYNDRVNAILDRNNPLKAKLHFMQGRLIRLLYSIRVKFSNKL